MANKPTKDIWPLIAGAAEAIGGALADAGEAGAIGDQIRGARKSSIE